jgi:thermopsin
VKSVATSLAVLLLLVTGTLFAVDTSFSYDRLYKLPASQSITIPNGFFIPLEIDSLSNSTWLAYSVQSNVSISTALMNFNQFNIFNNSNTPVITNAINVQNGTSAQGDLHVSLGAYYLVFLNYQRSGSANVTFTTMTYPFTPFIAGPIAPPQPTGIASFGLYNISGNAVPYAIQTSSIVGTANISSIQAYNSSAPTLNDTVSGATLQLNAELVVEGGNGSEQVYWAQDTSDFITSNNLVSFNDNLWNNTALSGYLSNQTVTSPNGNSVFPTGSNASEAQYFYAYGTNNYTYVKPFDLKLLLNESILSGQGILVKFGTQVLLNGSGGLTPVYWFDNVTIKDPSVQRAYFYVNGNDSTPIGSFYDAELVFCGEGNLEETNFTQMSSTLGLYYLNNSQFVPFPSYYSFGGDTGETADNLHVNYDGNGVASVSVGTPNYVYLGQVANVTVTSVSSSTSNTAIISLTSSPSSIQSSSSSSSSGASELSSSYFLALVPAVLVIILVVALLVRRKKLAL